MSGGCSARATSSPNLGQALGSGLVLLRAGRAAGAVGEIGWGPACCVTLRSQRLSLSSRFLLCWWFWGPPVGTTSGVWGVICALECTATRGCVCVAASQFQSLLLRPRPHRGVWTCDESRLCRIWLHGVGEPLPGSASQAGPAGVGPPTWSGVLCSHLKDEQRASWLGGTDGQRGAPFCTLSPLCVPWGTCLFC